MTQKEAVEKLRAWLPQEAYFADTDPWKARTVAELYDTVRYSYAGILSQPYHFSQVPCNGFLAGDTLNAAIRQKFLQTPCICIKVNVKNNRIIWFKEHLPYKGDCHDEPKRCH